MLLPSLIILINLAENYLLFSFLFFFCQYPCNTSASQIEQYFGLGGLKWKTPFMKRFMSGWSDNVAYPLKVTTDASALHARVMELY